jgi:hypothetical protein
MPALPPYTSILVPLSFNSVIQTVTLNYQYLPGSVTQTRVQSVADQAWLFLNASFRRVMTEDTRLEPFVVRLIGGGTDLEATSAYNSEAGDSEPLVVGTGDLFPESVAVCIQRRTGLAGRQNRGRIFLPFVPEAAFLDSAITVNAAVLYRRLAFKLSQGFEVTGLAGVLFPVHLNRKDGAIPVLTECRVVSETSTRRDRRQPKRPSFLRQMA